MIAIAKSASQSVATRTSSSEADLHQQFLELLPSIHRQAAFSFRRLGLDAREEAVQEAIAHAFAAFTRLVRLDKLDLAYAAPLARFAVARVRDGRSVGSRLNADDVMATWCQKRRKISIESLDQYEERGGWREVLVEDGTASPADIATSRIDFSCWLESLSGRDRRLAEILATGEKTRAAARRFGISAGRVSQMRRKLHEAWQRFQGEVISPANQVSAYV
jgi:hypothetical protein